MTKSGGFSSRLEKRTSMFVFYATAIYTGCRAGELAALEWPDVDFDRRLITVQRSFDGPTKSDRVRYVPILDPLLPVLRAWRLKLARSRLAQGESFFACEECGTSIPEARRRALPGVRKCVPCQSESDRLDEHQSLYNRRGSKDSQLK